MNESDRKKELRLVKQSKEGDQATQLLNNPQFKAMFEFQRSALISQFQELKPTDTDGLAEISRRIKSVNWAESYLIGKVKGGDDAKSKLEQLMAKFKRG